MDTFIVRIYRYGNKRLKEIIGLVEIPGNDGNMGFTTIEELWAIFSSRLSDEKEKHQKTE
jgi:hypothetical protein